jgi:uncharacterized protein YbjT (DUF2867 family)
LSADRAPAVVVLGATGSLGRAVCAAAERVLPGVRLVRAARRARGPDAVRADVRDAESLRAALRGAAVAIAAVGPFDWDPGAAIRACREAGCHWVDLADRPGFLCAAEAAAGGADVAVVSGASVAPGFVEALAARTASDPDVAALRAWWSIGSRKAVSAALLFALLRPLGRRDAGAPPRAPGPIVAGAIGGAPFWFGRHPWPRGADARLAGRRVPIELHVGMDHRAQAIALRALVPLLGRIPEPALRVASRAVQPATHAIQRLGGARGALAVESIDGAGRVRARVEILARNGLDLAALPPLWAARALLDPAARARGAVSLAALVPRDPLAAAMRAEDWIVTGY